MKKNGGTRVSAARVSATEPRESWRKWTMTLLALGFALLVITLLSKENKILSADLQNAVDTSAETTSKKLPAETVREGECGNNTGECLMYVRDAYYPQGLGVVEGYYTQDTSTDWDGNSITCDAFVITDGSKSLLEGFGKLVDAGSGFIQRNSEENFLVKIDFSDVVANMTPEEVNAVRSSTEDDQAELHVFVYQPKDGGSSVCQSPFAILEIE